MPLCPTQSSLRLAELLCARLCHELSSPMGTLAGVLEMLAEGGAAASEARDVAEEAARTVRARLRLLRTAWSGDCPAMPAEEVRAMAEGLRTNRRSFVRVDTLSGDLPGPVTRLVLNLMLTGVDAMAGAGTLYVAGTMRTGVTLHMENARGDWPAAFMEWLNNETAAWAGVTDARTVQAALTAILTHAGGVRLSVERTDFGAVRLRVKAA